MKNALVCTPTWVILDYFNIDFATSDYKLLISYYEGKPVKESILSIWSTVEFPGNKGFCARI